MVPGVKSNLATIVHGHAKDALLAPKTAVDAPDLLEERITPKSERSDHLLIIPGKRLLPNLEQMATYSKGGNERQGRELVLTLDGVHLLLLGILDVLVGQGSPVRRGSGMCKVLSVKVEPKSKYVCR